MKTDKELLELAAKAANYKIRWRDMKGGYERILETPKLDGKWWSPLTDDGDALRLAVKLDIDVMPKWGGESCAAISDGSHFFEPRESEPLAATRRAIVRAAAAIGEKL